MKAVRRSVWSRASLQGRVSSIALAAMLGAALVSGPIRADDSEGDDHPGLTEYEIACMPCHGVGGKGDGPEASRLSVSPADLTIIARSSGGTFPSQRVAEIIDGRAEIAAHGLRDMPVWGARYRATREPGESVASVEARVNAQIKALVEYLAGIQEP